MELMLSKFEVIIILWQRFEVEGDQFDEIVLLLSSFEDGYYNKVVIWKWLYVFRLRLFSFSGCMS